MIMLRRSVMVIGLFGTLALPHAVGAEPAAATVKPSVRPDSDSGREGLLGTFSLGGQRGPVTISADRLEFDYRTGVLTYRGRVTVAQADVTMQSNVLRVTIDPDAPDQLREIIAEGAVRIAKGDRLATGGRAVFDQATRTVVLSDQAKLRDGPNEVAGERVVVYLDEERSVVESGENDRVRAVLFPPAQEDDTVDEVAGDEQSDRP